ncbi:hypothetical protein P0O24_04100 [Methanotrichaceae archaeon M04Ac]|jgi:hypothetical protein|uniref:Uncharacterized protein n=1 Tax=Candidatus Methanocrinis alkalitolerans TaxID=3033395 RepID=A0ABT5XDN2_9EURY|nr:hypothetical protein [Candidatus Methanocrinis alkalitolerans]MDF0592761.1 hypothetical protein [Candidatus Methanocrinis alkalitolerans]
MIDIIDRASISGLGHGWQMMDMDDDGYNGLEIRKRPVEGLG